MEEDKYFIDSDQLHRMKAGVQLGITAHIQLLEIHSRLRCCTRVAYRIFLWGGGGGSHISAASRGSRHAPPDIFLYSTFDSDLILGGGGGGGELKLEGGNPSTPPPLYATLCTI